jgi:hypothetical protein
LNRFYLAEQGFSGLDVTLARKTKGKAAADFTGFLPHENAGASLIQQYRSLETHLFPAGAPCRIEKSGIDDDVRSVAVCSRDTELCQLSRYFRDHCLLDIRHCRSLPLLFGLTRSQYTFKKLIKII